MSGDKEFEKWWKKHGIETTPLAIGLSYKEVAKRAWDARGEEIVSLRERVKQVEKGYDTLRTLIHKMEK